MTLTSLNFILFFLVALCIYYVIPTKIRWIALLTYSVLFFVLSAEIYTGIYLVVNILTTYIAIQQIYKARQKNNDRRAKVILVVALLVNVGILALLKYSNFAIDNLNGILTFFNSGIVFENVEFVAPIGLSYYTLISVGYLVDCYWRVVEPEKNIFKVALFIGYFPQMTSGPMTRYTDVKDGLFGGNRFSYQNITFGSQRILWGFFKKLVIAPRVGIIVDAIYSNPDTYVGIYSWMAILLFMLQLYADFSGCMDIIMGVSECFGITLPENFQNPFFSRTVQEFWQRWHITLGGWLKNYIFYPILRTEFFMNLPGKLKPYFGKKTAKRITTYSAMFILWFAVGLWHGGDWKYILGQGVWFWGCIVLSQIFDPVFTWIKKKLEIDETAFGYHLFQSIRVFILVSLGNTFFRAESFGAGVQMIKNAFVEWNPWILFDGSIVKLGVEYIDINIIIIGVFCMFVAACLREKNGHARNWIQKQFLPFRWFIWVSLFVITLIYGMYGPGYDAASFIYEGF